MNFIKIPGQAYEMQQCPVTQYDWTEVMGTKPFYFKDKPYNPAENISWDDCQEFIKELIERDNEYTYSLPTEEQWEYCCRAGSQDDYCFGNDVKLLEEYAWFRENSEKSTQQVGQKKSNTFGLYDMHGNVWEWTRSFYSSDSNESSFRVLRGGGWYDGPRYLRSAYRDDYSPGNRYNNIGFRLLRTLRNALPPKETIVDSKVKFVLEKMQNAIDELKELLK